MMRMILSILVSLMFLAGCATTSCSGVKSENKKKECKEANKRFHEKTGWRHNHPHSIRDRR